MKEWFKRTCVSFAISSFVGLVINLLIDVAVNAFGSIEGFVSIPPAFAAHFPTSAMAAYANVLLYGLIGASFAAMTFVFQLDRVGFLIQYLLYFCLTGIVLAFITMYLWELQQIPQAMLSTLAGYGVVFAIMGIVQYSTAKRDIDKINELIVTPQAS